MNQIPNNQASLLDHMKGFEPQLPSDLLEAVTSGSRVYLNMGDVALEMKPKSQLFFESMRAPDFKGEEFVLLRLPTGRNFAYDPNTGEEIANTLDRYGVTDRTTILDDMKSALVADSAYLRAKDTPPSLVNAQDRFIDSI